MSLYDIINHEAAFGELMKNRAIRAEKQRDEAQAKAMALHEAARALLGVLDNPHSEAVRYCQHNKCHAVATLVSNGLAVCDAHGLTVPGSRHEIEYAPAMRRLRALTSEDGFGQENP